MNSSKFKHHERLTKKLNDPKTAAKTYWSILTTFVNSSKIPLMPPLSAGNRLVTDFLAKTNLFNDFFSKLCSTKISNSTLPINLTFETGNRISTFDLCTCDTVYTFVKDIHREKAPSNKTPARRKSTNMGVWAVGTLKYNLGCYLQEVLKLKQNFQTNKVVAGKTLFSVIDPFCSYHSICLNIGF